LKSEKLVDIIRHPNRVEQQVLVYERNGYCWAVPCVVGQEGIFLKTAYPSRKMTKKYIKKEPL
jgi:hypothetical protein